MGVLSRWFPVHTLDAVGEGAHARLDVIVVTADVLRSPLGPVSAAAFRWTLLYQRTAQSAGGQGMGGTGSTLVPFLRGWRGGPIVVRAACGRTIEVALESARLDAAVDPEDGMPLGDTRESASVYGEAATRAPEGAGLVFVREHAITHGQALVLHARLEPVVPGAGGYRDAASKTNVAFRTTGELTLEDRSVV